MSTDADLGRRVRVHAALADPARLHIVDALRLGDASPTELQRQLGLRSNLLSHHLGALQEAGLITRHRSEADRRRTYLHLESAALTGLVPDHRRHRSLAVSRVLFVCTANSARSQLAAALWGRASDIPAASAGTHPGPRIAAGARAAARRHGLSLGRGAPRHLQEVRQDRDYLVTVCDNAYELLHAGDQPDLHWSVADPVAAGTRAAFESAVDDLTRRVANLAPYLAAS